MGVGIARQQKPLKAQQTRGPYGGSTPKPGENPLRHDRLHLKEEPSTHCDCQRQRQQSEVYCWSPLPEGHSLHATFHTLRAQPLSLNFSPGHFYKSFEMNTSTLGVK